uniref:Uncharacterized protein n=1 Tax=Sinocyclocheilus rhinocerous TaxID=307959 RepID=A0A673LXR2_9TELE
MKDTLNVKLKPPVGGSKSLLISESLRLNRIIQTCVPMYQMLICGFCFFQEDNGMPVHLKGGTTDALLYRICGWPLYYLCLICFSFYLSDIPFK